jgi:microcystin-dependent protein
LCDGAGYSTTDYASLHNAIGYIYGGSGAVFHVPDLRGRSPVGAGTGAGLTARSLGQTGGEENHVNTSAQSGMPSHNHGGSTGTGSTGTGTTGFISADHTHVPGSGYTNFIAQNGPVTNIGLVLSSGGTDTALGQTSGVTVNHTHSVPSLSVPALSISTQAAVDATQAHNTMHPFAVVNWFVKT